MATVRYVTLQVQWIWTRQAFIMVTHTERQYAFRFILYKEIDIHLFRWKFKMDCDIFNLKENMALKAWDPKQNSKPNKPTKSV